MRLRLSDMTTCRGSGAASLNAARSAELKKLRRRIHSSPLSVLIGTLVSGKEIVAPSWESACFTFLLVLINSSSSVSMVRFKSLQSTRDGVDPDGPELSCLSSSIRG